MKKMGLTFNFDDRINKKEVIDILVNSSLFLSHVHNYKAVTSDESQLMMCVLCVGDAAKWGDSARHSGQEQ